VDEGGTADEATSNGVPQIRSADVEVVRPEIGERWRWTRPDVTPVGTVEISEATGGTRTPGVRSPGCGSSADLRSGQSTVGDSVIGYSYLGWPLYKWRHDLNWNWSYCYNKDFDEIWDKSVSDPHSYATVLATAELWSYHGIASSYVDTNQSSVTALKQGKFSGSLNGVVSTGYPRVELEGNWEGHGRVLDSDPGI
jgi:hypothetical protein